MAFLSKVTHFKAIFKAGQFFNVTIGLVRYAFAAYHWDCFLLYVIFPLHKSRVVLQDSYDSWSGDSWLMMRRMWRHPYLWLDSWLIVYYMWPTLRYMWYVCYLWLDSVLVILRYIACTAKTWDFPSRSSWLVHYRSRLFFSPSCDFLSSQVPSKAWLDFALRIPSRLR